MLCLHDLYRFRPKMGLLAEWILFQGKALGWSWSGLLGLLSNAAMGQKPPVSVRDQSKDWQFSPTQNQSNSPRNC